MRQLIGLMVPIVNQFITKSCRSEASITAPTVWHIPDWLSLHKLLDPAFLAQLKIECKANSSFPEIISALWLGKAFFVLMGGGRDILKNEMSREPLLGI